MSEPHCAERLAQITNSLSAGQKKLCWRRESHPAIIRGEMEVKWGRESRRQAGRKRPAESEVTRSIRAADLLHEPGRAFNWELNLKNQATDESDKRKKNSLLVSHYRRGS